MTFLSELSAEGIRLAVLECQRCERRYRMADVLKGAYRMSTEICKPCYEAMACSEASCFGDFDPDAIECRKLCPDRHLCIVTREVRHDRATH